MSLVITTRKRAAGPAAVRLHPQAMSQPEGVFHLVSALLGSHILELLTWLGISLSTPDNPDTRIPIGFRTR